MSDKSAQMGKAPPKQHSEIKWLEVGLAFVLLAVGVGIAVKVAIDSRRATPAQNKQLSAKIESLAKAGNCQNGLNQLNKVQASKYDDAARTNVLMYQLLCNADKDPAKALAAGKSLEEIYKKQGNKVDKSQQLYVENVMQSIQQKQQAGSNAK